jgi:hypothetical protein
VPGYLPTLYKARGLSTKQPVCAVCVDRTRGRTSQVRLTHGVAVWLCEPHASPAFQIQRNGRDFVRTLSGVWKANGCMTAVRHKALQAHLRRLVERPARPRPGSYSWPKLRRTVERAYAGGASAAQLAGAVHERYARCPARPPSRRTLERWRAERRWLAAPP